MSTPGYLQELFASFQGEGTHVGRRHVFVRTAGCSLRCRYCDTPAALVRSPSVRLALPTGDREVANPVTAADVGDWVEQLDPGRRAWVSFTGGEPLEQAAFLAEVAARVRGRPVYLETAGVHAEAMRELREKVDFVALDFKLASVAREGDRREQHRAFLAASRGLPRLVKAVVNADVEREELREMGRLLGEEDPALAVVLQPETPRGGGAPQLSPQLLEQCWSDLREVLQDVRVIPQTHRFLSLP